MGLDDLDLKKTIQWSDVQSALEGHCPQSEVPALQHSLERSLLSASTYTFSSCLSPVLLLHVSYSASMWDLSSTIFPHPHLKYFPLSQGCLSPIFSPLGPLLLIPQYPTQNYLLSDAFHSLSSSSAHSTLFDLLSKTFTPKYCKELFT